MYIQHCCGLLAFTSRTHWSQYTNDFRFLMQGNNTTNQVVSFSMGNEKDLLRWDSNPRHTAYEADALPTEPPRQPSCSNPNQSNARVGATYPNSPTQQVLLCVLYMYTYARTYTWYGWKEYGRGCV